MVLPGGSALDAMQRPSTGCDRTMMPAQRSIATMRALLPGVGLGCFAGSGQDLVESLQGAGVELNIEST